MFSYFILFYYLFIYYLFILFYYFILFNCFHISNFLFCYIFYGTCCDVKNAYLIKIRSVFQPLWQHLHCKVNWTILYSFSGFWWWWYFVLRSVGITFLVYALLSLVPRYGLNISSFADDFDNLKFYLFWQLFDYWRGMIGFCYEFSKFQVTSMKFIIVSSRSCSLNMTKKLAEQKNGTNIRMQTPTQIHAFQLWHKGLTWVVI